MPPGHSGCSCDPAGAPRGHALVKGSRGQSTPDPRERGFRVKHGPVLGVALDPSPFLSPPQESPDPSSPPCHRSCGPSEGPGWECCRLLRPPRCWSRPAGAACRAGTGAPWTAGPWGARPPWRAALGTRRRGCFLPQHSALLGSRPCTSR